MAVNTVALSGPGEMERLGSISAFIFHNNVYKRYCNIKKMIMKYGEIQKFYVLFFQTTFKSLRLDLCGAREETCCPLKMKCASKKLNFGKLEYLRITPLSSKVKTPVQQSTI